MKLWYKLENSIEGSKHSFKFYQSNSEGEIINIIHDERIWSKRYVN